MKEYYSIPLETHLYPEAWYSFPQYFTVPKGCIYKTDSDEDYQSAYQDLSIALYCAGDWLEIVDINNNCRIQYEIY